MVETTLRRCVGSKRYGIEPHEAPAVDFPKQPSQKDGLGRMCKTHWNQYTAGIARDAKERKAAVTAVEPSVAPTDETEPKEAEAETAEESVTAAEETPAPTRARRAKTS